MLKIRQLFVLGLAYMIFAAEASAKDFQCLLSLQGQRLNWDSGWQRDGADANVPYTVTSVSPIRKPNEPPHVVLQLQAAGPARIQKRTATIYNDDVARRICARAKVAAEKELILPSQIRDQRRKGFVEKYKQAIEKLNGAPATSEFDALKKEFAEAVEAEDYIAAGSALKRAEQILKRMEQEARQTLNNVFYLDAVK